jgi:hypothetical protein
MSIPKVGDSALAESSINVDRLKLAFIYKFTSYVKWPNNLEKKPLKICFYRSEYLRKIFKKEQEKLKLNIEVCDKWEKSKVEDYDFVYLGQFSKKIVDQSKTFGILTISHHEGYAQKGVMVNFTLKENRLTFEINKKSVDDSNLSLSSQLLKLGVIIE